MVETFGIRHAVFIETHVKEVDLTSFSDSYQLVCFGMTQFENEDLQITIRKDSNISKDVFL